MAYIDFQMRHEVVKLKRAVVKVLLLLFLNGSVWLAGSFLFIHLEGSTEAAHKCGVKRVQRNFVDELWLESQATDEEEWKSVARRKMLQFEQQLHEAVEAGVSTYSGQKVWSQSNTLVYCFTLATTIGYGHLTPTDPNIRMASMVYGFVAWPLVGLLVAQLVNLVSSVVAITALSLRRGRETRVSEKEEDSLPLDLLVSDQGASPLLLFVLLFFYSLAGAAFFASLHEWSLPTGLYFVLSSLSTVGFGDVVPQDSVVFLMAGGYVLLGMALFSLWQTAAMEKIETLLDNFLRRLAPNENQDVQLSNGRASNGTVSNGHMSNGHSSNGHASNGHGSNGLAQSQMTLGHKMATEAQNRSNSKAFSPTPPKRHKQHHLQESRSKFKSLFFQDKKKRTAE